MYICDSNNNQLKIYRMAKENILTDECLQAVMRNEALRIKISEVSGIKSLRSIRNLAMNSMTKQKRNKLYDVDSLEEIKKFMGLKTIKEMYKPQTK